MTEAEILARLANIEHPFAASLRASYSQWGRLTPKQLSAAARMIAARDETEMRGRAEAKGAARLKALSDALDAIKAARVHMLCGVTKLTAKRASAGGHYLFAAGRYSGWLARNGWLSTPTGTTAKATNKLRDDLAGIGGNAREAVVAYGRTTGICGCCGRELTDPDSIAAGIGPVCATKFK